MINCYVCSNKAEHFIYNNKPVCNTHLVEAVNEEKGDILIFPIVKETKHTERFDAIGDMLRKLYDIRKSPIKYALSDLSDWLEWDLEKVMVQLDELQYDVEKECHYVLPGFGEEVEA